MKQHIQQQFFLDLDAVQDEQALEALDQEYFSRKSGKMTELMKGLKDLSPEEKKQQGQELNALKQELEQAFEEKRGELERKRLGKLVEEEGIDVTQSHVSKAYGHLHPITQAKMEMEQMARSMGMIIEDGPELESDYYNFGSLNFPDDHPARESMDTFYIKDKPNWLMRAHISNMQVRLMRKYGAPLRAAHPGRVYRNEAIDATHGHTFYQFDALVIDKNLSVGDLIGTLLTFLKGLYKEDIEYRIRPAHFPFVEPGFEIDMKITYKAGDKIKTKWMEVSGCGMIHPNVLREGGIDPEEWTGYAFDFGLDRLVLSKYGIEDIRHIHGGDLRFLKQF